jgi:hypothetical protein
VLNLAAELLLATKSTAILSEELPPFGGGGPKQTVLALLLRCQTVVQSVIGVGRHGMMRMQSGDWSDPGGLRTPGTRQRRRVFLTPPLSILFPPSTRFLRCTLEVTILPTPLLLRPP